MILKTWAINIERCASSYIICLLFVVVVMNFTFVAFFSLVFFQDNILLLFIYCCMLLMPDTFILLLFHQKKKRKKWYIDWSVEEENKKGEINRWSIEVLSLIIMIVFIVLNSEWKKNMVIYPRFGTEGKIGGIQHDFILLLPVNFLVHTRHNNWIESNQHQH
jgi:hypothetical protein